MTDPIEENRRTRILIVDDDPSQRSLLHSFLRVQGFQTTPVGSGEEALRLLAQEKFDMMISDVRMPGISGLETMRRARAASETMPILLVTAYADIREAVGAMRDGALNYLSKPIDLDELLRSVRDAVGLRKDAPMTFENKPLPRPVVAQSSLMRAVLRDAALIAPSETRVLITGESGAGKELLAGIIHGWSGRASQPLTKVSCVTTPEDALGRELFGDKGGRGLLDKSSGGTVLLDEIAGLSPQLQSRLLHITQAGEDTAGPAPTEGARLLATTSRNLEEDVSAGRFREDLFYRLAVVELNVPPLRERREDILPLATHFLEELTKGCAKLAASVAEILEAYAWPGNVRELRNALERAALLSRGELILPEHLPSRIREPGLPTPSERLEARRLEELEEQAILTALRQHQFNRTDTARALGISRRGLLYKLQHLRDRGLKVDP